MRKNKLTVDGNRVTLKHYDEDLGEWTETTYHAPYLSSGEAGYVRILTDDGRNQQVCEKLYTTGNTLEATPETLPAVIRRELRRRIRHEKRLREQYL